MLGDRSENLQPGDEQGVATSALNCLTKDLLDGLGTVPRAAISTNSWIFGQIAMARSTTSLFSTHRCGQKRFGKKRFCVFPYAGEVFPPRWGVLEKPVKCVQGAVDGPFGPDYHRAERVVHDMEAAGSDVYQ